MIKLSNPGHSCEEHLTRKPQNYIQRSQLGRSTVKPRGPDSVVGIASGYGLNGPGIECRWGQDFPHLSRPALWPIQPPVQWVSSLSRG